MIRGEQVGLSVTCGRPCGQNLPFLFDFVVQKLKGDWVIPGLMSDVIGLAIFDSDGRPHLRGFGRSRTGNCCDDQFCSAPDQIDLTSVSTDPPRRQISSSARKMPRVPLMAKVA